MRLFALAACCLLTFSAVFAQSGTAPKNTAPELIFQNPSLVYGTAGADGAVYRFPAVTKDVDALVRIVRRSEPAVVLSHIDVPNMGWSKAFQPQLGIKGNVPRNKSWWMDFKITFVRSGTTKARTIKQFTVTALDVDGDGVSIQEFVKLNNYSDVRYSSVSYLRELDPLSAPASLVSILGGDDSDDDDASSNTNKLLQGPVQNFHNIDTAATQVMATYDFEDRESMNITIGGTSGKTISNAGERLNALWFKSFSLAPRSTLPVQMTAFAAQRSANRVLVSWATSFESDFSHFVVERSEDGKQYKEAATVFAHGTATTSSQYAFRDALPVTARGTLYYRLRLVEKSGEANYSEVRTLSLQETGSTLQLTLFPNPAQNDVQVGLPAAWQGKGVVVDVFSATGSKVKSLSATSAAALSLNLQGLNRGTYIIRATCDGQSLQQRIIKQ